MSVVTIIGLGPGPLDQMTKAAEARLMKADRVFFRTRAYPAYDWLRSLDKKMICFDYLYTLKWPNVDQMYGFMVNALIREARLRGRVAYAVPGSPWILEDTTQTLIDQCKAEDIEIEVIDGMSFIEPALASIGRRFDAGLQMVLPRTHLETKRFDTRVPMLVCQIGARRNPTDTQNVDFTIQCLLAAYPRDHEVTLIWTSGLPDYVTQAVNVPLGDLARAYGRGAGYASLFVPPAPTGNTSSAPGTPRSSRSLRSTRSRS